MNSSALSPTCTRPCLERRGLAVGWLSLDIEGHSRLLDNVDRGLMKIDKLRLWTKKNHNIFVNSFFSLWRPYERLFSKIPQKGFGNFWVCQHRLAKGNGLHYALLLFEVGNACPLLWRDMPIFRSEVPNVLTLRLLNRGTH